MSLANPRVAFVHIPRTAGTSFGTLLDELYCGRQSAKFYGDEQSSVVNEKIDAFRCLSASAKAGFDMLRGHFVYGFDSDLRDVHHVTLLREPTQRLVSFYFYALKDRSNYLHSYLLQRRLGLEQFLQSDATIDLDNYQVRAISGVRFRSVRERVSQRHLDEAKYNLVERFTAFGLTEQFDQSMNCFARKFMWDLPHLERKNEGAYGPDVTLSESCLNYITDRNQFDMELYSFAKDLFESTADAGDCIVNQTTRSV
ncbi:sulfotransferase family 2 domain-containing protein [Pseudomonas sp. 10B1]|nr:MULTISPECIES: sulfotransferase family 2 domain-containing protein [unclassified Pseudomonas]MEA9997082.1 sulfotransferase family 2 domain-containing protein [Pseudomonas sp. AA4]MEB0087720.1 sulfotransferase family 2 domain-containing protein [Pseudomonas sp. RTI1]MEB0124842.1 sulfotransferase family 2 domain-containing protein [Pseudomonas sp. CCC1.2]MEB0155795.1 sulfotransferase family 2 domain-containing protein [Pseudomonas sp. CCC4.3]MEB0311652.1 sulfotransferase family 2 domain-contai